ncbi:MAG: hypothetical protein R2815_13135 [Flavobacteriales bacterium]|nr:hypothetical protein [Flavobacteriales bacterium]
MSAPLVTDIPLSMRLLFISLLIGSAPLVHAQLLDSIGIFLQEDPRFVGKLDMRGSFISNRNVRIAGIKFGLEHARRFQYGLGYSFLLTPVEGERDVPGIGTVPTRLRIGYITPYVDYAFYQRGDWEVRIPVQFGFGSASLIYHDAEGRKQRLVTSGLLLYEPGMSVQYRILKYVGIGGGLGLRIVIPTNDSLGERLSAPTYSLGLRIFFGDLWRDLDRDRP